MSGDLRTDEFIFKSRSWIFLFKPPPLAESDRIPDSRLGPRSMIDVIYVFKITVL